MKEIFKLLVGLLIIGFYYSCQNDDKPVQLFKKINVEKLTNGKYGNTFIEVDPKAFQTLENKDSVQIYVPHNDGVLTLDLKASNETFIVNTSVGESFRHTTKTNYVGTLKDDINSVVTISLNKESITGLITSEKYGTLTIAPTGLVSTNYVVYNSMSQSEPSSFICLTQDTTKEIKLPDNSVQRLVLNNKLITMDYEVVHETYKVFGNDAACINWITGMFNSVKALYKADGFNVGIKSIYLHKAPDTYSLDASTALTQVRDLRRSDPLFKGTFTHLVRGKTGGAMSGIAYVGTLCQPNYRFGYVEPMFNWSTYPAYSWSINVLSHELGHNGGSPHSHSCSWPGGPLDNCYQPEGTCALGLPPVNGGTLMSYCHMKSYGMNFNNGFGEKPKALIQSKIDLATCLEVVGTPVDTVKPIPPPVVQNASLISLNKSISQTTTYAGGFAYPYLGEKPVQSFPASYCNDADIKTFSRTEREVYPRIIMNLNTMCDIKRIVIRPRVDCCYNLGSFALTVDNTLIYSRSGGLIRNFDSVAVDFTNVRGQVVSLNANQSWFNALTGTYLQISDFRIYGSCGTVIVPPVVVCKYDTIKVQYFRDSIIKTCK